MDLSIIFPARNEELAIRQCIIETKKACKNIKKYEIIVVDNASTDKTAAIAKKAGAKVVREEIKGYGAAIQKGIETAQGIYVLILDADMTYDPAGIPHFYTYAQKGYDFVIGNRFVNGQTKKSMKWLHRNIGNPILSGMLRLLFHSKVQDAHCGMRLINRKLALGMRLSSKGMEFASEMVIKAGKNKLKTKQINIPYNERIGESKLDTWKDGWRHLRFMMMFSPKATYTIPGTILLILGGALMTKLLFSPLNIGNLAFYTTPMIAASVAVIAGYQILITGYFAKVLANNFFGEKNKRMKKLQRKITLEKGLGFGISLLLLTIIGSVILFIRWVETEHTIATTNPSIFLATLATIGIITITNAFYFIAVQTLEEREK